VSTIIAEEQGRPWIDTFAGVLVSPRATLAQLADACEQGTARVPGAAAVVIIAAAVDSLVTAGHSLEWWTPFAVAFGILSGLAGWLLVAAPIGVAAIAFGADRRRVRASFITTAWAFAPWILIGPLSTFRNTFGLAAVPLALIPLFWVAVLQWLAIQESYRLKSWQTLFLLVFSPQLFFLMYLWWSVQITGTGFSWLLSASGMS
jgi:hypothetical protein